MPYTNSNTATTTAPHSKNAALRNQSESPYQQRTSQKANPTQQLIKQAVDFLLQQLEAGKSETLTAYLAAMARFHSYSFGNILSIARQRPSATRIAGFYAWKEMGRFVKRGEKGIQILAPMVGKRRNKDNADQNSRPDDNGKPQPVLIGFRAVYVFDVAQTEGADLPEFEHSITGEVGEHRDRLIAFLNAQNITLEYNENIAPALGVSYGGKIAILPGQSPAEDLVCLVHETAHELLHKSTRRTMTTATVRETEAEAVAFIVGQAIGLEMGKSSSDYIQMYAGNAALLAESLEVVQCTSAVILDAITGESATRQNAPSASSPEVQDAIRAAPLTWPRSTSLSQPKYSIEQIAARVGKQPSFVASRIRLIDLVPAAVEAFYANEIGVGHALLLAKLPADQQEQALSACFKEVYNGEHKPARILLPVRNLQLWIESNVLLVLKDAPFDKRDAQLVSTAGSCADCPKRTGHNKLLFGDDLGRQGDRCTDPGCYQAKLTAHVAKTVAAKPELVQISTAYGTQKEGSPVLPRNKYTAIRDDKPKSDDEAKRPEFKVCKFTTDAIVTEGSEIGTTHKVCANQACPVHHPKKINGASANDAQFKAEQEKRHREEAIANATGLRVLSAISAAVPVRLMKRDLLFVAECMVNLLDENRAAILAKQHGIKKTKENESVGKLFTCFLRRADESTLGRAVVEAVVLLTASRGNASHVLRDAAEFYKVDVAAITTQVKQEFAAKEKAKAAKTVTPKPLVKAPTKTAKRAAAA